MKSTLFLTKLSLSLEISHDSNEIFRNFLKFNLHSIKILISKHYRVASVEKNKIEKSFFLSFFYHQLFFAFPLRSRMQFYRSRYAKEIITFYEVPQAWKVLSIFFCGNVLKSFSFFSAVDIESIVTQCCNEGNEWGTQHKHCNEYQFNLDKNVVPAGLHGLCLSTVEICCAKQHRIYQCQGKCV